MLTFKMTKSFLFKWRSTIVLVAAWCGVFATLPDPAEAAISRGGSLEGRGHSSDSRILELRRSDSKSKIKKIMICSPADDFGFQRTVLLTFLGRPGTVTDSDVAQLQQTIGEIYNLVAACPSMTGGFLDLLQVNISRNDFNSFGSTFSTSPGANLTQEFTYIATVRGNCRGCRATPFQLFSASSSSRRVRSLTSYSPAEDYDGAAGSNKVRDNDGPPQPPIQVCLCPVPSQSLFLDTFNSLMAIPANATSWRMAVTLPSSVDKLVDITELNSFTPCVPNGTTFETVIAINLPSWNATVANQSDLTSQYALLASLVVQSYNSINALNTGGVCDTSFIFLLNATITPGLDIPGNDVTPMDRRGVQVQFKARGGCGKQCPGIPPNIVAASDGRRRKLEEWPGQQMQLERHQEAIDVMSEGSLMYNTRPHLRRLPFVDGSCFCAINATLRLPTEAEFLNAFNSHLALLEAANLTTIVGNATSVVQVVPANCSLDVNYFLDSVEIGLTGFPFANANLSSAESAQLSQAFMTTYNDLAQEYCDPLFRTVETVQLSDINRVQSSVPAGTSVFLVFNVTGRCRGCSSSTVLCNDSVNHGRALEFESQDASPSSFVDATSASLQQLDNENYRGLQATINQTEQCYCNIHPIAYRSPNDAEFLAAFNNTLAALGLNVAVTSIFEGSFTLAPSKSPSARPTPPPSPLPTASPTLAPSNPPTLFRTTPPTFVPTVAPYNPPTLLPTAPPTFVPVNPPTHLPTARPTFVPTVAPVNPPTQLPTTRPTFVAPSNPPTPLPTAPPTLVPTVAPTNPPTLLPTVPPTFVPTVAPTNPPTPLPTAPPTDAPVNPPTRLPTRRPTFVPTMFNPNPIP
jgi:hypothetical protein